MPLDGEYEPSPLEKVRNQVALYERTGGREGNTSNTGPFPVVVLGTRGSRTGKVRKNPLVRIEHDGIYAVVACHGGADEHPTWYYNLKAHPDQVTVQDGPEPWDGVAREVTGAERALWWERAVAAFPRYADHQRRTDRQIPVFVVEPRGRGRFTRSSPAGRPWPPSSPRRGGERCGNPLRAPTSRSKFREPAFPARIRRGQGRFSGG